MKHPLILHRHFLITRFLITMGLAILAATSTPLLAESAEKTSGSTPSVSPTIELEQATPPTARLQLDDKQREAYQKATKNMRGNAEDGRKLQEQIRKITHSDQYDEKTVRKLIQAHHQEREESMVKSSKAMHEFYQSLSPEQKKQFDALQEQRHKNMVPQGMKPRPQPAHSAAMLPLLNKQPDNSLE